MSKKHHKPYDQMNAAELAEATREYDREQLGTPGRPLTKRDQALHRRAKKLGRPRKGAGSAVVGISIERGLLKQADALAKRRKIGRSEMFVSAVRAELERAEALGDHTDINAVRQAATPAAAEAPRRSKAG